MANTNAPFGLRPVRYFDGSPWNGKTREYYVRSDYATALYIGDPVVIIGEGNQAAFLGRPAGTLSAVNIATVGATNTVTGVIVSVEPQTNQSYTYKPASTESILHVADDPNIVYEIQDDGGGSLTYDTVGLNAVLVAGTGSTYTGKSGWALDGGTATAPGADATYQLFILGLSRRDDGSNTVGSDYAIWDVLLNLQTYKPAGGLGIA